MSFPRYEKYKDSGVTWLGDVPSHWQSLAVWLLFELGRGRVISNEEIMDNPGEYPVYSSQTENNGVMGCISSYDFDGDYLTWTTDGANAGTVFKRNGKFNCTNVCGTLKARNELVVLDYCVHALSISTASFVRQDINPKLMNNVMAKIRIPFPSVTEQQTIAAFLGGEISKIDELIAEQQRLIELLKEKRQVVISHFVTKGLNPNAPMKNSGINWLGDVPKHWRLKRIKHLIFSIEQGWSPQCENYPVETSNDWGVLKVGCVNGGRFNPTENKALPLDLEPIPTLAISEGDVLISRANTRELVGSAAVASESYSNLMLCDKLYRLKVIADACLPEFIVFYLGTGMIRGQIELAATGASSSMLNIGQSTILEIDIALPSVAEQLTIINFLNEELAKFNALTTEAQRGIGLLKERRTALISAAVTGKIDVRWMAA